MIMLERPPLCFVVVPKGFSVRTTLARVKLLLALLVEKEGDYFAVLE